MLTVKSRAVASVRCANDLEISSAMRLPQNLEDLGQGIHHLRVVSGRADAWASRLKSPPPLVEKRIPLFLA